MSSRRWCDHSKTKVTEPYFPVVLFIMLHKVVLTFESVDEILKCDPSNESYWAVLSCGAVYYAVQGGSNFWVCGWNPEVWPLKWKLLSSTFQWCCLLCCTRNVPTLRLWMKSSTRSPGRYFLVGLCVFQYRNSYFSFLFVLWFSKNIVTLNGLNEIKGTQTRPTD